MGREFLICLLSLSTALPLSLLGAGLPSLFPKDSPEGAERVRWGNSAGTVICEGVYSNGVKAGEWIYRYSDGSTAAQVTHGSEYLAFNTWYRSGKRRSSAKTDSDGHLRQQLLWDKQGRLIRSIQSVPHRQERELRVWQYGTNEFPRVITIESRRGRPSYIEETCGKALVFGGDPLNYVCTENVPGAIGWFPGDIHSVTPKLHPGMLLEEVEEILGVQVAPVLTSQAAYPPRWRFSWAGKEDLCPIAAVDAEVPDIPFFPLVYRGLNVRTDHHTSLVLYFDALFFRLLAWELPEDSAELYPAAVRKDQKAIKPIGARWKPDGGHPESAD